MAAGLCSVKPYSD